jgi:SAM-dependent methyltransferase
MDHPLSSRLRDALPVNRPYAGLVAEAYDAWIPVDELLPEESLYRKLLSEVEGTVLELGCGTGRPMLRWLADGIDVEGSDASTDMLAILRRHAAERGLDPVVHHGDIAPLSLDRTYSAIVCPAGTFSLVHDAARASAAVTSWFNHLEDGGLLALTAFVPAQDFNEQMAWRVRRTGTTTDGRTIVVHEATCCDLDDRVQILLNRLETFDAEGRLQNTTLRRMHLRWWPRDELAVLLSSAGFIEVDHVGSEEGWVTSARRPG